MTRTIARGFAFPEGPRWHEGRLWFADQHGGTVYVLDPDGHVYEHFAVPGGPSGMGWLPDGALLVVSMDERRLYRRGSDGQLVMYAELAAIHSGQSNDMVVDHRGWAYAGNVGFDYYSGEAPWPTCIAAVAPDGAVAVAADHLHCPNGSVITPDCRTFIVAETFASRLTAFDIDEEGRLFNRRIFADLGGYAPDGICLDAEGCVWVAVALANSVIRVREGGEILTQIPIEAARPYACMLGGMDGRDLFICCASDHDPAVTVKVRSGRIDVARVNVGSSGGWP
ncbi:SMP-30/gluconolactonase/LRE family protein [Sphingobium tyrosinilyticum]|uniref:SMP-30/gluconolactonase/LRE family protein n=1 Tax=Sphingobium tyrosinilyticum TaxID=2715436 RepID=A0ABV9F129_9SPHN